MNLLNGGGKLSNSLVIIALLGCICERLTEIRDVLLKLAEKGAPR